MLKEKISKAKKFIFSWAKERSAEIYAEIKSWEMKKMTPKKIINIAIFLVALGMGIYFQWGIMNTLIFLIFIGIILRPVSSRIMALPALFFLILTPFALILEQDLVAENLAIYAYYFLIMATIMGIREVRQEDKEKPEN
jgi:hypothetical protein